MALLPESFLEICQDLVKESPISGEFTTVTGVTGEFERVVNWVATACLEIESAYLNWNFLSVPEFTFTTVASTSDYPPPADWNWWDHSAFGIPADDQQLEYIDWNRRKRAFETAVAGDPFEFTILPSGTLRLYDTPTSIVTIQAPYWVLPTSLVANADTPLIPVRYRKIVTYRALKLYAEYEANDEIDVKAVQGFAFWMNTLSAKELPANRGMQRINTGLELEVSSPQQQNLQATDLFF